MDPRGESLCAEAEQLRGEMSALHSVWQDCADHALPLRRLGFNRSGSTFSAGTKLQSDVAVDSLNTLASGMVSWVTPGRQNWFAWQPADALAGNEGVADWLADCTMRAHRALEASNFYHCVHLAYLDLGAFGTVGLYCEAGRDQALNFKTWHCGTFACAENSEGRVDRTFRFFNFTAQQAVERFGAAAPEKCHQDVAANRRHNQHPFVHAIYPREWRDRNPAGGPLGMPVASCFLSPEKKTIVLEEGYDSLPVMVSRWLKWSDESPYGASPAMMSIADIRGSNCMEMLLAAMANLKVNPRVITQTGSVGTVHLGAGGITQVKSMGEKPEVWADPSDYRVGLDLLQRVDQRIERAFYKPLFEQFAQLDREMTTVEVRARQSEQMNRISPAFTLLTTDLINPLLERVFMVLFRGGHFAEPPPEAFVQDGAGQWRMLFPKVIQISRMSQAIEEQKEHAFAGMLETFLPLVQFDPSILDNLDFDAALRDIARGKGVPQSFVRQLEAVMQIRQARQQQAQVQQALELAAKQPDLAMAAAGAATGQPQQQAA